jgi:predicted nucleic acid-binding Zn ribbon protein
MKSWGKGKVKRQIGTGAGLIFKGSGFYITDYRSDSYKSGAKNDSTSASDSGAKKSESTKSETPAKGDSSKSGKSKPKASE